MEAMSRVIKFMAADDSIALGCGGLDGRAGGAEKGREGGEKREEERRRREVEVDLCSLPEASSKEVVLPEFYGGRTFPFIVLRLQLRLPYLPYLDWRHTEQQELLCQRR